MQQAKVKLGPDCYSALENRVTPDAQTRIFGAQPFIKIPDVTTKFFELDGPGVCSYHHLHRNQRVARNAFD